MTATTRASTGIASIAQKKSWRLSQNPSITSGALARKCSPAKNWRWNRGQFGLLATTSAAPPNTTTVDRAAIAAPTAPS